MPWCTGGGPPGAADVAALAAAAEAVNAARLLLPLLLVLLPLPDATATEVACRDAWPYVLAAPGPPAAAARDDAGRTPPAAGAPGAGCGAAANAKPPVRPMGRATAPAPTELGRPLADVGG
jgi:hypothetical protein